MKLKIFFQIFLITLIIVIIFAFYYSFIHQNKSSSLSSKNNEGDIEINTNKEISSELQNIEYNSYDEYGNSFYIYAEKALAELNDQSQNNIKLFGVVSVINIADKGIVNIYSEKANYNKLNNNTYFIDNVRIEYLNKSMFSENLDMIFTEKKSKIYNNVIYKSDNLILYTDEIFINHITGDIKLEMKNKNDKVKLTAKNEFIN
tara:strand:- start:9796 stop:10404 length:609 start_codon:yes stop_codon:yes gene_type:complete